MSMMVKSGGSFDDGKFRSKLGPNFLRSLRLQGQFLTPLHQLQHARADLQRALRLDPQNEHARSQLEVIEQMLRSLPFGI